MNKHQKILLTLFARHPDYLLRLFFTYYPLSNEQIVKFKGEIKWGHLSSNSVRIWDQSFIEKFADKLNWDALSANPSLPWSISFLKAFETVRNNSILDYAPRYEKFLRHYGY